MPRSNREALAELSCWMEQAHQLASAIAVLDGRIARRCVKSEATPLLPTAPHQAGTTPATPGSSKK